MVSDTRARLIETTAQLVRHRGYHGTSLNDILAESGAPRGSLYFHFPGGKDQLVVEATRATVERITANLRDNLAASAGPASAVRRIIEATADLLRDTDYRYGCPIAPVILDATNDVPELAELCRQAFAEWIGLLQGSFGAAGIPTGRAHSLAILAQSSVEGAMLIARAYRDCAPLVTVASELEQLIEAALPSSDHDRR